MQTVIKSNQAPPTNVQQLIEEAQNDGKTGKKHIYQHTNENFTVEMQNIKHATCKDTPRWHINVHISHAI